MRIMPFRTAATDSVTYEPPVLHYGGISRRPDEPASDWDYSVPLRVTGAATVDPRAFLESTGLDSLEEAVLVMTADCPATGFRELVSTTLRDSGEPVTLELDIPDHEVAVRLEVTYGVLLGAERVPSGRDAIAHRKGSRLHRCERTHGFPLEGNGSGFPIEAFDFHKVDGLPNDAPWVLEFSAGDLHAPFLGVTRLFVNQAHPVGPGLLSGTDVASTSVLKYDVTLQMFNSLADQPDQPLEEEFPPGSVGEVLGDLADLWVAMGLAELVAALRNDRSGVQRRLQNALMLLHGERS